MLTAFPSLLLLVNVVTAKPAPDAAVNLGTPRPVPSAVSEYKNIREEAVKERQNTLNEIRSNRQEALKDFQVKREEFKKNVREIKSETKQKVLTNLVERFANINEKWVSHWENVLDRFSKILTKMEDKIENVEENSGKDTKEVASAINEAKKVISSAREAVKAQAGKVYLPEVNDEATLGENVRLLISQFRSDLRGTFKYVQDARKATYNAFLKFKLLFGEANNKPSLEMELKDEQ